MTIDYTKTPVEELLPHTGDMVLIDRILEYDPGSAISSVRVSENSLFYDKEQEGIHAAIGIEWMAQTIAAVAGIYALQNHKPVQIGFLLGTRKYQPAKNVFKKGEEYTVRVKQLYRDDNGLGAFEGSIHLDDQLIAESKLNVFAPDNVEDFLKE